MRIFQKSPTYLYRVLFQRMVVRTARSIPEYTTILGQATSPCGSLYAAATLEGQIAVWRTAALSSAGPIVRQDLWWQHLT